MENTYYEIEGVRTNLCIITYIMETNIFILDAY
jgi:hypothetical protein